MRGRSSLLCYQSAFFTVGRPLGRHCSIQTGTISPLLCCRCGYLVSPSIDDYQVGPFCAIGLRFFPSIGHQVGIMAFGRYTTRILGTLYACRWLTVSLAHLLSWIIRGVAIGRQSMLYVKCGRPSVVCADDLLLPSGIVYVMCRRSSLLCCRSVFFPVDTQVIRPALWHSAIHYLQYFLFLCSFVPGTLYACRWLTCAVLSVTTAQLILEYDRHDHEVFGRWLE